MVRKQISMQKAVKNTHIYICAVIQYVLGKWGKFLILHNTAKSKNVLQSVKIYTFKILK